MKLEWGRRGRWDQVLGERDEEGKGNSLLQWSWKREREGGGARRERESGRGKGKLRFESGGVREER